MTRFCTECFGDEGLKRRIIEIRPNYPREKCSFHPRFKGVPSDVVASIVGPIFEQHYHHGEYNPYHDEFAGDQLEYAVGEFTESESEEIADALAKELVKGDGYWPPDGEEPFYDEGYGYVYHEYDDRHHSFLWEKFCNSITHEKRFFNNKAQELLAEIFDGIQWQRDQSKNPPIYEITLQSDQAKIHRARIADSEESRKNIQKDIAKELGPPPERKRKAGRMNSAGIATFYGGFNLNTCIAELRPVVGSVIVGAEFRLTRPIYVLDTTKFVAPMKAGSPFYKKYASRLSQWRFMQTFMNEIAKPISPSDEHIDYIPTQAVAEFFLHNDSLKVGSEQIQVEAIIYKSAQYPSGKNIVLLGDAANVEDNLSEETKRKKAKFHLGLDVFDEFSVGRPESISPGLRSILGTATIVQVSGAKFTTKKYYDHDDFDF
jgi:hypothetical protein